MPRLASGSVLVTGGAGFIGSHTVDALVAAGDRVTVLDDFSSGRRENLAGHDGAVAIVEGDICDERVLERALESAEVVLHLATRCVRLSLADPAEVHRVNSEGTHRLLVAAVKRRVRRFVYVSSSEIYGTAVTLPMREDHPLEPTTIYGATKLAGEFYTKAMSRTFGLETVVVRPFNTYGPRAHFEGVYGEVIPKFTVRLLNGRRPVIFGDGLQTRDFTYVTDTVRGILLAAAAPSAAGRVINVARGEEVTVRTLAALLAQAIDPSIVPEHDEPRPADVRRHWADVGLAKQLLGFVAEVGIDDGLRRYLTWFRERYPDPAQCLAQDVVRNF
jgi:UDP-glucose 4-epimerase